MAFTYDLSSSVASVLLLSRLRLEIGDKTSGSGVLPDSSNFTDEELFDILERADNDLLVAAAHCCDILATEWAKVANIQIGPRREELSQVAKQYGIRAKEYRDRSGTSATAFSAGFARHDAYAQGSSSENTL